MAYEEEEEEDGDNPDSTHGDCEAGSRVQLEERGA
jgi:hypothetical protein